MIIHVCRTSLHITATQLYVWLCSVHAYIAGAVVIVENPGYLMNTSPCLWVYLSCKNAAIDSWRKITHADVPANPTRPVFNVPNLFALRSDCCFGFIWCINVSQSLKLTDMTACKVRFPHDFLMSWNKRRSWNNAGHCHPLVMLFSSNILIHPKSTKNLRFLRHERICAIPDRFTLTMGMQRCMLGESKLHVHRDPEKGVCLRASVAVTAGDVLFREMPLLSASTAFAKSFLFCSGLHPVPMLELRVPSMFKAQFWRDTWMKVDFWYINNDAQLRYVREICGVQLLCDDSKKSIVSVRAVLGLFVVVALFGTALDGGHQQLRSCRRA